MVARMSMTFRITPRAAGHRVLPTAEAVLAGPEGVRVHNVAVGQQHEVMDAPLTGTVLLVGRPGASMPRSCPSPNPDRRRRIRRNWPDARCRVGG